MMTMSYFRQDSTKLSILHDEHYQEMDLSKSFLVCCGLCVFTHVCRPHFYVPTKGVANGTICIGFQGDGEMVKCCQVRGAHAFVFCYSKEHLFPPIPM